MVLPWTNNLEIKAPIRVASIRWVAAHALFDARKITKKRF